jgi:hypothetical protein
LPGLEAKPPVASSDSSPSTSAIPIAGCLRPRGPVEGRFSEIFERVNPEPPDIDLSVTGSWQPSATVLNARERLESSSGFDYGFALLIYLLLSHATLLGALVWLFIRHLK